MISPIFVVGSPRSGTSYLSRALGLAEDTCYLGESAIFCLVGARSDFYKYQESMKSSRLFPYYSPVMRFLSWTDKLRGKNRVRDAVAHLFLMSKIESYDLKRSDTLYKARGIKLSLSEEEAVKSVADELSGLLHSKGISAFAKDYLDRYSVQKNCSYVIEKTPTHLRFLPLIHRIFPDAKIVLIRRDKRECYESYFRTFGQGEGIYRHLPEGISKRLVWRQLKADLKREEWAKEQSWVKTVEFGDLVENPQELIMELSSWLGIKYDLNKYGALFPADMTTSSQL